MAKKLKWYSGFHLKKSASRRVVKNDDECFDRGFDISLLYDVSALLEIASKEPVASLKDANGYTLLHHAADLDCSEALEFLLAKKG